MIEKIKNYFPYLLAFLLGALTYNLYSIAKFNDLNLTNEVECSMIYNASIVKEFLYSTYIDAKEYQLGLCEEKLELSKKEK